MAENIAKAPRGRPNRKRINTRDRLLLINKDSEREYRLIDSDPARVYQFEQAGWKVENVKDHLPGVQRVDLTQPVENSIPVGGGARQVLVSIEKEFYEDDQRAKQAEIDQLEKSLKPHSEDFYGKLDIQK